jgi:hypothetical protein
VSVIANTTVISNFAMIVEKSLASLDQTNGLLREMIRHGYRSPVSDLTPLLGRR